MADANTLKSVKTSVDSGIESRHSAKSYRTFRTLKTRHSSESAVTLRSKKTKNSYLSQSSKSLHSSNTNLRSLRGTCNTPKSSESERNLESREHRAMMGVLPTIKEFNRKKELKGFIRDPLYNSSEQLVFYDSHGRQVTDRLSSYDSGITKDISDTSYQRGGHQGFGAMLSPVKSESASPRPRSHTSPQSSKDWRKFFDMVPNAAERRQMEQIRREMEAGKLKPTTLPPISYFAEDLPMLPGEAGTRLLQTVRVGEKVPHPGDGRHRIESVPGKLAVHTQNE
ncbi:hypothetical protein DPMN_184116 [Dreissena polymorpha]|uniref:Uncharacterized protein n=1 Tax=Dreissena polymorpha TaxID=45954 RepID=A0A9D4DJR0_DREPO|nr:hypothetical protein DPMN_184116 [Dreissena polymorpha]